MKKRKALTATELRDMKVLVVGLGRSGMAACGVLRDIGSAVKATDTRRGEDLDSALSELVKRDVQVELGRNSIEFAGDCDLLVMSPGVPLEIELVRWARTQSKTVIGEVELAWCLSDANFVAVTGTNGKSTTVSLLGTILSGASSRVRVGGNIGLPISSIACGLGPDWTMVIEISSFQLDTCLSFSPSVSVLLNITPDHLDRYPSYEAYAQSKAQLFANQTRDDMAVINHDDRESLKASRDAICRKLFFSLTEELDEGAFVKGERVVVRAGGEEREIFLTQDLRIRGPHNLANSLAASLAATALGLEPELIRKGVREFEGLEHRLEFAGSIGGVDFINDSKATNLDSLKTALEAMHAPVLLIAGGRDKGGDFTEVSSLVGEKVKTIYAIGEAREKLRDAFSALTEVRLADGLEAAVRGAMDSAAPSDVVLLSPGCASFDMFDDFEHRGRVFKQIVTKLKQENEAPSHG
ncbi:MAG: UDP-N-acetylmuramoyl-L-alanine--D-glutamate ligase [Candidatus Eisenbacteria bacterium]